MKLKYYLQVLAKKCLYGYKANSDHYISHLNKIGVSVGCGCVFYDPMSNVIDESYPFLLKIGRNVRITHGVIILTHDYSWSVIAGEYGECLGGVAPVIIGDNVFIGMNAIIMKGCTIGSNVIIGAGSVVTKDCDPNSVYAGMPAKKIMTLDEYRKKKENEQVSDVNRLLEMIDNDKERLVVLREYEPLFMDHNSESIQKLFFETGYQKKCNQFYENSKRPFLDYKDLMHHI